MSPPNDLSESPVAKEYARRRDEYRVQLTALDRQGLLLANARLLTFAAFVVTLGLTWAGKIPEWGFWISGLSFVAFVVAAVSHDRILKREERTRILVEINARGLARLDGTWTEFVSRGDRFLEKGHAYANDLNIFGKASLFQLLDTTGTRLGEDTLGGWLSKQSELPRIEERHAAVAELAPMLDFREGIETEGKLVSKTKADSTKLLAWAESTPLLRHKKYFHALAFIFPPITCGLYVAGKVGLVNEAIWYLPLVVQLAVVVATREASMRVFEQVSSPGERFIRFEGMFALLEQVKWKAPLLAGLRTHMEVAGAPPSLEMRRLGRAISFLQIRLQPLFHFVFNVMFLWDIHWIRILEEWQVRCGPKTRAWFTALGEIEALCALAAFSHDNPELPFPALVKDGPRLIAKGLGHPLIPKARRISNDVSLDGPGNALLVTGSNMSGKTTLLRTLGVNAVLGLAGAPVCAKGLTLSPLEIRTSMRVEDSLSQGLSYFYAELTRLKTVVDACDGTRPVMFLLDEILLGTNTAERQLASRAILKRLVERGAIGAVTTHDLALTTLEEETHSRIRNVHFTDAMTDDRMTFDYVMRPGVVTTTNALALLKLAGIDVEIVRPAAKG